MLIHPAEIMCECRLVTYKCVCTAVQREAEIMLSAGRRSTRRGICRSKRRDWVRMEGSVSCLRPHPPPLNRWLPHLGMKSRGKLGYQGSPAGDLSPQHQPWEEKKVTSSQSASSEGFTLCRGRVKVMLGINVCVLREKSAEGWRLTHFLCPHFYWSSSTAHSRGTSCLLRKKEISLHLFPFCSILLDLKPVSVIDDPATMNISLSSCSHFCISGVHTRWTNVSKTQ